MEYSLAVLVVIARGEEYSAHTATSELSDNPVRTQASVQALGIEQTRRFVPNGGGDALRAAGIGLNQRFHFQPQFCVARAGFVQKQFPLRRREIGRGEEQSLCLVPFLA